VPYRYVDLSGEDMRQPVVDVALRYRSPQGEQRFLRSLAVVDTASSICTAPPEVAEQLGFAQPLMGPKRRLESGAGAIDYWMAEIGLTIVGQSQLRAHVGFGGTRRYMHLGYLNVLEHFLSEFRPYESAFSLKYVPPL